MRALGRKALGARVPRGTTVCFSERRSVESYGDILRGSDRAQRWAPVAPLTTSARERGGVGQLPG